MDFSQNRSFSFAQLTPAENDELDKLIDEYERRVMEKAEALVKLKFSETLETTYLLANRQKHRRHVRR